MVDEQIEEIKQLKERIISLLDEENFEASMIPLLEPLIRAYDTLSKRLLEWIKYKQESQKHGDTNALTKKELFEILEKQQGGGVNNGST